jgi:hypothetical protein
VSASSITSEVAELSNIFIELAALKLRAPSAPADKVKSPAISTAPAISNPPVKVASSHVTTYNNITFALSKVNTVA